jgi:hypothetical protein
MLQFKGYDTVSGTHRSMANFATVGQAGLVRIIRRKPKKIQYRPHLINCCLSATGSNSSSGDHMHYEFNLVNPRS